MVFPARPVRPRVFLSFAGTDRDAAVRLRHELHNHGFDAFIDRKDIRPGGNILLTINDQIEKSNYFVLLWSEVSAGRPWVEVEWTAAQTLELDLRKRRSFLIVVRLTNTYLPAVLAPRRCLDAFDGGWDNVVEDLVSTWEADMAIGLPVYPAPVQEHIAATSRPIILYVRNGSLSVAHTVGVPEDSTAKALDVRVRKGLALQEETTLFNGKMGIRLYYRLLKGGQPIPDGPLTLSNIKDGTTIDLEVRAEPFGPSGSLPKIIYLNEESDNLPPSVLRRLIMSAFGHLMP
jgi:hypothetical protein